MSSRNVRRGSGATILATAIFALILFINHSLLLSLLLEYPLRIPSILASSFMYGGILTAWYVMGGLR